MHARRLFLALVLILALPLTAQQKYAAEVQQLERFIEQKMRDMRMPGLSVAIRKDDFVYAKGFGFADVENGVKATEESSYRMASVTKPMTAVAVMKLVEQGKINLDAEVQTYVPYFPKKAHPVTIRQLLQHLGGISHYKNYDAEGHIRDPKNTKEALAVFQDFDLIAEPGTRYSYSSYGYNLLGAVIEGASGRSYGDYMRDEIWKPLGMNATRMDDPRAIIPNRARGYILENGQLRNSEYVDISSRFAAGGTRSTVRDMLAFAMNLERVLKPETIEEMWTGGVTRGGEATRYGLGFSVIPRNGRFIISHNGAQQETRTTLDFAPHAKFAVALASNFENADLDMIASRIATLFLGDRWYVTNYVPAKADQQALWALGLTWNNGLGYYDRYHKLRATDAKELAEAFRYFNDALRTADPKKIGAGRHPSAKEAFIKVGAYMAEQLAKSGADLSRYHAAGELAFFDDYMKLYRTSKAIPSPHRFEPALDTRVGKWRGDWQRVWTADAQAFVLSGPGDLAHLEELAKTFRGSSIVPNYADALVNLGENAAQGGDFATAMRAAKLGVSIYPDVENTNGFAGVMTVLAGDVEGGKALLLKSRAIMEDGYAGKKNLTAIASIVERMGNKKAAEFFRTFAGDASVKP
ncbi:MAG TPA: serine hydrolase domain-containing protein [Thermoanaerobaculia bacterium]|jgi:CubicO group peptidase (beta-lactamase class C family)